MTERVYVLDTTLRDGEQSPGVSMTLEEKLRLALQSEKLGVDIIEAGFSAASKGEFEAVLKIAKKIKKAMVAALCRINIEDIKKAWGSISHAVRPRIHTFIATSDIHMKHKLKKTPKEVLKMAVEGVKYAKSLTSDVQFSAEDATRSDRDFLCQIFEAVIKAGATTVNIADTVGYATPEEFSKLIKYVLKNTPGIGNVTVSVHCHDDLGMATANTLAAIKAGARQVEVTMNGIGERAGNAALEEVVMALKTRKDYYSAYTDIKTELIYPTSRMVSGITGMTVQPNKAVVGDNAFSHKAGIHQDGMLKNPLTYEIMTPKSVGREVEELIFGKHSGSNALRNKLEEMGHNLSDEEFEIVFQAFKKLADRKKEITDGDLEVIIAENLKTVDDIFRLVKISTITKCGHSTADITISKNGEEISGKGEGNGVIEAVFNVLAKLSGNNTKLLRFNVRDLSPGVDAIGSAVVYLEKNGIKALGGGLDKNIINACAKAYINGLNRLEYLKNNSKKFSPQD